MGLQNQFTDVSSDSLPIFFLSIIATAVSSLRSFLFTFLRSLKLLNHSRSEQQQQNNVVLINTVGNGLAELILLADQLNINRVFSYKYSLRADEGPVNSDCVVCLNCFADGERVRKLECQHVFHKECFDGWLDCFNFKCPLCRSPVVSEERMEVTRRRLADDVIDWFSFRS